jgi:hypothetical protein
MGTTKRLPLVTLGWQSRSLVVIVLVSGRVPAARLAHPRASGLPERRKIVSLA